MAGNRPRFAKIQIREELALIHHIDPDTVRVIKDRYTGCNRGFAFCRFPNPDGAEMFVRRNASGIFLGPHSTRVTVTLAIERSDRERPPRGEEEWRCSTCALNNFARRTECFRCGARKTEAAAKGRLTHNKPSPFTNSGDSDASDGSPSQFLLIRGLEPGVSEELLAKGIAKLYRVSGGTSPGGTGTSKKQGAKVASTTADTNLGARRGSVKKVLLVRDRNTDESRRYGFAEFASVEDSQAALAKFNSLEKFTISSKPVLISNIHAGVFVPELNAPTDQRFTFSQFTNPLVRLSYWDESAYVSKFLLDVESLDIVVNVSVDSKRKKREDSVTEKEGSRNKLEGKEKKRKAETVPGPSIKKSVPVHFQFWGDRYAELHGAGPEKHQADPMGAASTANQRPRVDLPVYQGVTKSAPGAESRDPIQPGPNTLVPIPSSHLDYETKVTPKLLADWGLPPGVDPCRFRPEPDLSALLSGQPPQRSQPPQADPHGFIPPSTTSFGLSIHDLASAPQVGRPTELGSLGQATINQGPRVNEPVDNSDPDYDENCLPGGRSFADKVRYCCLLCSRRFTTLSRLYVHEFASNLHRENLTNDDLKAWTLARLQEIESSPYRDRAHERREAFGQPVNPAPEASTSGGRRVAQREIAEAPEPSRGATLLRNWGWNGAGLGAEGDGITAPIAADAYVQGVGLGAEGGRVGDASREAGRLTRGDYSEFLERTKDQARERFGGMD